MDVAIGLGNIGLAIARRLHMRGREVLGVDIDASRRDVWNAMTGRHAGGDLEELPWSDVDNVFVIVRLTDQAEEVLGQVASVETDEQRTAFVITTLDASFAADRLEQLATPALRIVELPVSGGEVGALGGRLTAMSAPALTEADRRLLQRTIVSNLVEFDAYGQPTLAKLFNNVLSAYNARALAEMLVLAEEQGLQPRRLYDVVLTSSGGSWMATAYMELLDEMLDKDVDLLRQHLDGLPAVSLDVADDLPARLAEARRLL